MNKRFKFIVFLLAFILALWFIWASVSLNLGQVIDLLVNSNIFFLCISLIISIFWLSAYLYFWFFLLGHVDGKERPYYEKLIIAQAFSSSLLARYIPGKVALVLARTEVLSILGIKRIKVAATVLIEQMKLAISSALYSVIVFAFIGTGSIKLQSSVGAGLALIAFGIVLATWIFLPVWGQKLEGILPEKYKEPLKFLNDVVTVRVWIRGVNLAFLLSICQAIVASVCSFAMLGIEIGMSELIYSSLMYPISRFLGQLVVFAPAGIGAREAAFVSLTNNWLSIEAALAICLAMRLIALTSELLMFCLTSLCLAAPKIYESAKKI
jgi:hypothetical protein